ncbi:pyruvate dehydrogenase E1 component alpha subunit [Verrucomicrobium sp. GAS474]|uniref:pyruvate dehydrogenase (acetyl-transferring) E1 component subunit alpha n=1 Tax=Verrucomicrobium sp. GAS474 TaxID=1882831 RepID=UPI00087B4D5D|nr:pyruvate dehydrogenase (acetyl-transferring) E1 component subunit alpha [Verrucomicrobium sp. GAS474]SDT99390.1 pyruvate dehydrogenase E1 component alpha subunit [Verrucomicrobium sp. GAS474]
MPAAGTKSVKTPSVAQPVSLDLPPEGKLDLYRQMLLIRRFEEKAGQAFTQSKVKGFCHLYIGQEAVGVGTISVLEPRDAVITAYRDHGHAIARGMEINPLMAELFGKATGCSRGKGGSMHFFSKEKNFYGGHGIVGGQTPLGAGIAFAQKYQGTGGVTLCYLGDGAVNQGPFHEALNLAALWKLPVIYIIENNEWSMGTSLARSSAGLPLVNRAHGYDMAGITADGMDIDDVRAKTAEAVALARSESQPTLMEIKTYRYRGHSMSDPGKYRTKEELEKHLANDPIHIYKTKLIAQKVADEAWFEALDEKIRAEVQASYDFAEASPEPELHTLYEDVLAPEDQIPEIPRVNYNHF